MRLRTWIWRYDADAGFRSITEAVDTTTAAGCMVMQVLDSFADFERSVNERGPAWRQSGIAT
jgi:hypothetical protein